MSLLSLSRLRSLSSIPLQSTPSHARRSSSGLDAPTKACVRIHSKGVIGLICEHCAVLVLMCVHVPLCSLQLYHETASAVVKKYNMARSYVPCSTPASTKL